jgi:aryl-alcohol dehydrogenase-like predicted oxidoreductase
MKYRRLGKAGPRISAIGMGRGNDAICFGDPLEREFNAAIQRALDLGINFFDSSNSYWNTRHEVMLGRALKGQRAKTLIATKCGYPFLSDGTKAYNGRPEYVTQCCDESLQRLGVDVIDLYYLHRVDPATPIEDTMGAMARLVELGKVRYLGICAAVPEMIRRAHNTHPLSALQSEYSLSSRDCEREVLACCRELGITFVPYAPLGRGLLTGRIRSAADLLPDDMRRAFPSFKMDNIARNNKRVEELEAMASAKNVTSAQLALAWLLAQGEDIVPIPGTSHARNVDLNAQAADIELTHEELQRLNQLYAPVT